MCSVLEVSENGYFKWRTRGIWKRKLDDLQLSVRIADAFHDNRGIYRGACGSPRIHAELKEQGIHGGRKRIVRLMRQQHMMAKRSRRKAHKTESAHSFPVAPTILKRDFMADAPNQRGIQVSMSRKGDCYENAMIESLWGTLKVEGIGQTMYQSREEAQVALFDYIEAFYNRKRKHASLGYLSPVEYEKQEKMRNP
jgi:transposase InsO family protein